MISNTVTMLGCLSAEVARASRRSEGQLRVGGEEHRYPLERDTPLQAGVLSEVDLAHATDADAGEDLEGSDTLSYELLLGKADQQPRRLARHWCGEEAIGSIVGEQRLDLPTQLGIAAAGMFEKQVARAGGQIEGRLEHSVDATPTLLVVAAHRLPPPASSSRRRKVFVLRHSRVTVSGWRPSTSAASSTLRPPK